MGKRAIDLCISHIIETEYDNFVDWFGDAGWDDKAVMKALRIKELDEDAADHICTCTIHDHTYNLPEVLAWCLPVNSDHIYVMAVHAAVERSIIKAPRLSPADRKAILQEIKDEH